MSSFKQFGVQLAYSHIEKLGDKLEPLQNLVDWKKFESILDRESSRGRPPYDSILMFKMLILQRIYGISDQELEYQVADRISFQRFLNFPPIIPDYSTVWRFREYITELDLHDKLWNEFMQQLKQKGIIFSKGTIQDATFITANPGMTQSGMDNRGRGKNTTRNEDGSWTQKNNQNYFGYKLHTKMEMGNDFITEFAVTTAKVHDNNIDLSKEDEIVYRDKGYSGAPTIAKGNASMKKAARGKKLSVKDMLRNDRISRKRKIGERPYAVIKVVMNGAHTLYTEIHRVFTQQLLNCFVFNLFQLRRIASA